MVMVMVLVAAAVVKKYVASGAPFHTHELSALFLVRGEKRWVMSKYVFAFPFCPSLGTHWQSVCMRECW